ncbi:MAG: sterol desaturase family protein [Betaproteobacteria bacterium]|nr:sterol desaturase family protein [Betaproteobacteria bacterium]
MASLAGIVIGFVVLGIVFYSIEHLFPAIRGQAIRRRGFSVDIVYWLFTPLVTKGLTRVATLLGVVVIALLMGHELGPELGSKVSAGFGPIAAQPLWLIALEMLVIGDFIGYWTHRAFHGRALWKFHAVHHCSEELDWLSALRLHPVNDVFSRLAQVVPLMLLGFPLTALAAYVPFLTVYAILLHANVSWDFGPLRRVIASPRFHRWHHTSQEEGRDRNFAGFFPLWDVLFGTYYMPDGKQPQQFGVADGDVPQTFVGQMLYPFRSGRATSSAKASGGVVTDIQA